MGSADALVSLWDVNELACVRTFSYLEWPVRTISFSHDGKLIAMASVSLHCDLTKKKCLKVDFRCGVQTVFRRKFLARKTRQKATSETFSYFEWPVRTGKSLSEALILASTNPQYEEYELQVQY